MRNTNILYNMPDMYILRSTSGTWERVETRKLRDKIPASREIICEKHVNKFSGNQCEGQKIVENMRQSWVKSSLLLQKVQGEAEQTRIKEGNRIKRPRFS